MKSIFKKTVCIIVAVTLLMSSNLVFAALKTGTGFVHFKTGVGTIYFVKEDGTVALGDGVNSGISSNTTELIIPADVTYFEKSEIVHPYGVSSISANALSGALNLSKVYIEGKVLLDNGALNGVPDNTLFITGNEETAVALKAAGVPAERVKYEAIVAKYVAFGDSIAAGYALPEYNEYDKLTEMSSDGDRFPTPNDAFVAMTGGAIKEKYSSVVIDNQAVSGWTSTQLLSALKSGEFDAALNNADVVTITIGSNDLLKPFIDMVTNALYAEFIKSGNLQLDADIIQTIALGSNKFKLRIPVRIKTSVEDFITSIGNATALLNKTLADNKELNAACDEFCNTIQPAILKQIKEKAPDAEIYWTTLYNPFYGVRFDLNELFPGIEKLNLSQSVIDSLESIELGDIGAKYIERMNKAFEVNTEGYTAINLYDSFNKPGLTNVSITRDPGKDTESLKDDILDIGFDPHPNTVGHKLIYDTVALVIDETYIPGAVMDFEDIKETDWFYKSVKFAYENGLMNGTSKKTFEPNKNATRAMVATVLWRLDGKPELNSEIYFNDVKSGEWYEKAIKWATEKEITKGYGDGTFGVDNFITREQLVTFFYRYANKNGIKEDIDISSFSDANEISKFALDSMKWAVGIGLITGKEENNIDPQGYATSAELATMLDRLVNR